MIFNQDIKVRYVTATSFPGGVMEAHKKLHQLVPSCPDKKYFGLSRPENGAIIYRAAAEDPGFVETAGLEDDIIVLKKGRYVSITINDFMKDIPGIEKAFKELLSHPGLDPNGYCVEWYINDTDVKCMIRLNE